MSAGDPPKQMSWANIAYVSKANTAVPPTTPVTSAPQHTRLPAQTSETGTSSPPEKQNQVNSRAHLLRNNRYIYMVLLYVRRLSLAAVSVS